MFELGLPGIVFLVLCIWLVRKIWRAARTESDLEGNRLQGTFAEELAQGRARAAGEPQASSPARLVAVPPPPPPDLFAHADVATAAHLAIVRQLVEEREAQLRSLEIGPSDVARRVEVLWVRSVPDHLAWCERRHAATRAASAMTRDVICVARLDKGAIAERWFFG